MLLGETSGFVDVETHLPDLVDELYVFRDLDDGEYVVRTVGELGADIPNFERVLSRDDGGVGANVVGFDSWGRASCF
ncbi:hypothetical protein ACFX10_023059 [Malus domestica]